MAKGNGGDPPQESPRPIPKGETAFALTERDLPDPIRLCDPWATEGVTIIAGRPKLGKTTLARQKLVAAAGGGPFFDSQFTHPCLCAFLCLEEGPHLARMKFRQANYPESALTGIDMHFEWGRGWEGTDMLDRYLNDNPDVQYVVIDSLSRFRAIADSRMSPFTADYEALTMLHTVAKKHPGVCIDVLHHTRKGKSEDPIDDISGTYGITAAVDTCVVLRHHSDGATMYVTGRLWQRDDDNFIIKRERGQWTMLGVNLGLTDAQIQTLEMIKVRNDGISAKEISDKLAITVPSAWERIDSLIEKGFIVKRHGRAYLKGSV